MIRPVVLPDISLFFGQQRDWDGRRTPGFGGQTVPDLTSGGVDYRAQHVLPPLDWDKGIFLRLAQAVTGQAISPLVSEDFEHLTVELYTISWEVGSTSCMRVSKAARSTSVRAEELGDCLGE